MFHFFSTWQRLLLALLALALLPTAAHAEGYALIVTLRDSEGQRLAGIAVSVRTEHGQELVRQVTDATGAATFESLPAVVRVAVSGQPRGGPALFQLGDDAAGVRLDLSLAAGPAALDLRVERDGLTLPDPATMLALEQGGPTVEASEPLPAAGVATPAPRPTRTTPIQAGEASTGVVQVEGPEENTTRRNDWVPGVTLLLVVATLAALRFVQRWRDAR